MAQENWQQIRELFEAALELDANERDAFVRAQAANDPALRAEVASLLEAHDSEGAVDRLAESLESSTVSRLLRGPQPGDRIDAFRIVRRIGRGGMGAVYLAERDEPKLRQLVALKILQLGLDSEDLLERFFAERQILADLQHPNIALLLDGGATEDGLPYFTMEFVDGLPIDEHCDAETLDGPARIALVRQVCNAIEYAHGRGVVHRDLKPGNIFVRHDGVPKVLDFGIAKLFARDAQPSDAATLTQTHRRRLTLEYASPEQLRGGAITPATDVYSLGVLLYRLLAGHPPYEPAGLEPGELERLICDEPIDPPGLGDALDSVLLCALDKDPARRYATAGALSEALESAATAPTARVAANRVATSRRPAVLAVTILLAGAVWFVPSLFEGQAEPRNLDRAGAVGKQVLWVDDRPENNRQEADRFWEHGYDVVTARSTVEALRLYRPGRFLGVVSDMGRWEDGEYRAEAGFELLTELLALDDDVRFVFYTNPVVVETLRDRMLDAGAAAIPSTTEELVESIENARR
ncbi:MAG: protein kinase [Gemmatimonadota bacterium]